MKRAIKTFALLTTLLVIALRSSAQDAVVIASGDFVRGTIQGTNFSTVILKNDDETLVQYKASDIKEFLWNGETYVSKPIVIKKKMEHRFFKIIEQGAVNLLVFHLEEAEETMLSKLIVTSRQPILLKNLEQDQCRKSLLMAIHREKQT